MTKVLITGASSYVGARLFVDLKKSFDVVGTFHQNPLFPELIRMDVTNPDEVLGVVKKVLPDWIVHVAANPFGNWCEANPTQAKELNENGTKNVVAASNSVNAKIVYISSFAAINPSSVYGRTKLDGETWVKKTKSGFVILRPSLIIGLSPNTTNDRPFNRLLKNIAQKTPAVYDSAWKFQPTWLGHISEAIQKIIQKGISGETIPIAVLELKSRFDIAKDFLCQFGVEPLAKDATDSSPVVAQTQEKLEELGLPTYSYEEIVKKIVKETQDYLGDMIK